MSYTQSIGKHLLEQVLELEPELIQEYICEDFSFQAEMALQEVLDVDEEDLEALERADEGEAEEFQSRNDALVGITEFEL